MTTTAAGATGVTYLVDFTTDSPLPGDSTVTVQAPAGTVIPVQSVNVRDLTADTEDFSATPSGSENAGATMTYSLDSAVPAGERLELEIVGVTNGAAAANQQIVVSTSLDSTGADTPTFSLAAPNAVSGPSVSLTSTALGATGVTYRVDFTTSSTGGLAGDGGEGQGGTITVALPTGTQIPTDELAEIDDLTAGQMTVASANVTSFQNDHATAVLQNLQALPAGHRFELVLTDVSNSATVTSGSTGGGAATISTSSDTHAVATTAFSLTAPNAVSAPTLAVSSPAQGATDVNYTVGFTTSATGALAGDVDGEQGTITIALPTGTSVPDGETAELTDVTDAQPFEYTAVTPTFANGHATAIFQVYQGLPAGHRFELTLPGVTNASSSGGTVAISTSSDTTAATTSLTLATQGSVSNATVAISDQTPAKAGVTWSVAFRTSPTTGGLGGDLDNSGHGNIIITLPSGSSIPADDAIQVVDNTAGNQFLDAGTQTVSNSTISIETFQPIPAGDAVAVIIPGVTNPAAGSNDTVSVSTSSDKAAQTAPFAIGSGAAAPSLPTSVYLSSNAAGATGVSYAAAFEASTALAAGASITVTATTGTVFSSEQELTIMDVTTDQSQTVAAQPNGDQATYTVAQPINVHDQLLLFIPDVTNPGAGTSDAFKITTSQQQSTQATYSIVAAQPISTPSVSLTSNAENATGVTYSVDFDTSPSGGLTANYGTISVQAPGTLSNQDAVVYDLTTGTAIGDAFPEPGPGNTTVYTVDNPVPAGDHIRIVLTGVDNPSDNDNNGVVLGTSSDTAVGTGGISYQAQHPLSGATVQLSSAAEGVKGVNYTLDFTTSSTGALAADEGTITLTSAAPDTSFPAGDVQLLDVTTGEEIGDGVTDASSNAVTYTVDTPVPAGHDIRMFITGVTNAASSGAITVHTSSDTQTATASTSLVPAQAVTPTTVELSDPTPGASDDTYTIGFRTSSSGGLSPNSTITVQAPQGTSLPAQEAEVFDLNEDTLLAVTSPANSTGDTQTYQVDNSIPAGHEVRLIIPNVTNPSAGSNYTIGLKTSSDTGSATTSQYAISAGGGTITASGGQPLNGVTGTSVGGTVATFTVPDTSAPASEYSASIDWGDGSDSSGTVSGSGGSFSVAGSHTYAVSGSYTITVEITDLQNSTHTARAQDTASINQSQSGAIFASDGQPLSGTAGAEVTGTVATFTVENSEASASEYSATIDWGDGTTSAGTVSGSEGQFNVDGSHTYANQGSYEITVTITDSADTDNSANVNDTATINPAQTNVQTGGGGGSSGGGGGGGQNTSTTTTTSTTSTTSTTQQPPQQPPVLTISAPSVQSPTAAAFTGSVNPNGLATTAHFEYGLDPKYTGGGAVVYTNTTPDQPVGADSASHPVSADVTGLIPDALYHARLVASSSAGTTTGADQTFTTPAGPAPPAPVIGQTVTVKPVSGIVFIKLPGGGSDRHARFGHLSKGQGYIPLTEARSLPTGTQVDSRLGTLQLIAASGIKPGKTQAGIFGGGVFGIAQSRTGKARGLTTLSLLENAFPGAPTYASCTTAGKTAHARGTTAAASPLSSKVLQTLNSSDHNGKFRTSGRYASATVRGTVWSMSDRCDGTLTSVHRGSVSVVNLVTRKTVVLHAGQSYLASAFRARKRK